MKERIELRRYRPKNSYSFSGRPQGESVRKSLKLDNLDNTAEEVEIVIPSDTTSFNPSFFLGLLYDSISFLGLERFRRKYKFTFETDKPVLKHALNKNIEDGLRNATNSLSKKSGLSIFE